MITVRVKEEPGGSWSVLVDGKKVMPGTDQGDALSYAAGWRDAAEHYTDDHAKVIVEVR